MQILYACCCGLDVHKKRVSACLITTDSKGQRHKQIRTFGTTTSELRQLQAWLTEAGCTHVAMESTGPYWKPVYNLFEDRFTLIVANAQHIKTVPGRKTDVGDAEWIADLLQHGLIRPSFIPSRELRELRELTRYRKSLIEERADEANRVQEVLEGANIKLGSVATNVLGVSGRAILSELIAGSTDAATMAELAQGKLRKKIGLLAEALDGVVGPHQRFVLAQQLAHIDALDETITQCSTEISHRMEPYAEHIKRLCTVPGIGQRIAETLIAEIGTDMSRFPSARHLASWAGVCPGNHESAGKRKSGRTRKGCRWLRAALIEAARAAARTRDSYLSAHYHRLAARRGGNKASMAVAHSMLVIVYHLLTRESEYNELGAAYLDQRDQERVQRRLIRRLEALGCQVTVTPATPSIG